MSDWLGAALEERGPPEVHPPWTLPHSPSLAHLPSATSLRLRSHQINTLTEIIDRSTATQK